MRLIQSLLGNDAPPVAEIGNTRTSIFATGLERIALAFCLAASLLLLGWVLLLCRSGFDFTDEGSYLIWISDPWLYHASISQFGFVYHPLYKLVGGDIALLRQANVLIIFALAFGLSTALFRSIFTGWVHAAPSQRASLVAVASVTAAASLSVFDVWAPLPNYNALNYQSLMLVATGVLLIDRELSRRGIAGWILIGVAGWLCFLAKPTTAALLGPAIAACLAGAGKFRIRGLLISVAVAVLLLIATALVIDGSLTGFVKRFVDGTSLSDMLVERKFSDVFRADSFNFSSTQKRGFEFLLVAVFIGSALGAFSGYVARLGSASIAVALACLSVAIAGGVLILNTLYELFLPMQFWAISFAIALASFVYRFRKYRLLSRNGLALVLLFAFLPYAYAFGTNVNYWGQAARAGFFWLLAGFVVISELASVDTAWRKLLPAAAASLFVVASVLHAATEFPYRQTQPLRLQGSATEIGSAKSRLFLTKEAAAYVQDLRKLSADHGFMAGDPVLDLSGVSPGSLYAMGARSLGAAWTLAGYPGSAKYLIAAVNRETCETIAASWVLTEPDSRDSYSTDLLRHFGIDLLNDYQYLGSISSVREIAPRTFEHRLFKPARSPDIARLACENARRRDPVN